MAGNTAEKLKKAEIISKFAHGSATDAKDTGCPEVQVALITHKINELNSHFSTHPKDNTSKRGLLKMVGQRRRLLAFLRAKDPKRYSKLIQALALRK